MPSPMRDRVTQIHAIAWGGSRTIILRWFLAFAELSFSVAYGTEASQAMNRARTFLSCDL